MKETIRKYWDSALLALFIGINSIYIWLNGRDLLNSDVAAELMLAKQLNTEGKLLSRNWFYSSELRVLNTQLIYKPAFALFPNDWHKARTLSVLLFLLVLTVCAFVFAHALDNRKAAPLFALIMIAPCSNWYGWNVVYNSYYVPHIAITAIALSLYLKLLASRNREHVYMLFLASAVLAFIAGLGGVRQLMICYAPLFIATAAYVWQKRKPEHKEEIRSAIFSIVGICTASCVGFLVNHLVLRHIFVFENRADLVWEDFSITNMLKCVSDLIGLYGWHNDIQVLSVCSLGNLLSLVLVGLLVYCVIWCLKKKDLTDAEQIAVYFEIASFAVLLPLYSFTESYNASYWTVFQPFAFIAVWIWIKYQLDKYKRAAAVVLTVLTMIICSAATMKNPFINWVPDSTKIQPAASWLKANGYTQGFAHFWDSDVVTALTDGTIEMWTVNDLTPIEIDEWLQATAHSERLPDGRFFVLCPSHTYENDESITADMLGLIQPHLVYGDENYYIYSYDTISDYESIVGK